jgi:hypothetical protein
MNLDFLSYFFFPSTVLLGPPCLADMVLSHLVLGIG